MERFTEGEQAGPGARDGARDVMRLFELSNDLLAMADRTGYFTRLNPAWERVLGWSRDELMRRPAAEFIHPEDLPGTLSQGTALGAGVGDYIQFENRYRCRDGSYRWLQWNARLSGDVWYGVARDVTDRKLLERQALLDPLTGLPNRMAFIERLAHALLRLERNHGLVAVLFVDLDRFKVINDGQGHETGDLLLRAVALRLRATLRAADTVARLGGDEFVILIEDTSGARNVAEVGERIVAACERPFPVADTEVPAGASVGISITARADVPPEMLLREADIAMYRAKAAGGRRCELFDRAMRDDVERRLRVETELRHALGAGELELYYQPIVALPETSVVRCEALVRWRHPERGVLLPAEFVPLAEETGFIVAIGAWVLRRACEQAAAWRRAGRSLGITVNVSTRELALSDFPERVRRVLRETDLPPAVLCLEITETAIMRSTDRVVRSLAELRRIGVRIAMDDFGTGYSSLTYLRSLPLDIIKIDKSFVRGIVDRADDRAIVGAILRLARDTGLAVIGEGVETEAIHAELVGLGCELGQGFLYDRPKPAAELALDGYSSRVGPGVGDPLVIREFMRQIGIPARMRR
jgi:diguanylate cyclase (GGDEF)-like protein/PAS domain S-box-containing protein